LLISCIYQNYIVVLYLKHKQKHKMKTIRELRKILFDNEIGCYINGELKSNSEARKILFDIEAQDLYVNYTYKNENLVLWNTLGEIERVTLLHHFRTTKNN